MAKGIVQKTVADQVLENAREIPKPPIRGYAVLRLSESVVILDQNIWGNEGQEMPITNLMGFIPVFRTRNEAVAASNKGKYKIFTVRTVNKTKDK